MLAAISGAVHAQTKPTGTIQVTPAGTLTINEGDAAGGSLSVRLSAEPISDVTVSLAKTNADVTLSSSSLTFTTANWNTAQTVTVSAGEDTDATTDTDTITLSATGGIQASNVTKAVTITDTESTPAHECIETRTNSFTLSNPNSVHAAIRNSCDNNIKVRFRYTSNGSCIEDEGIDNNNFTPTFQWLRLNSLPAKVCVEYLDSTHQANSGYQSCGSLPTDCGTSGFAVVVPGRTIPSAAINVTPASELAINEGAATDFSVSLSAAPNADVTVRLAKTNADVTLSSSLLTFTTTNWSTSQTVTVSAAEDDDVADDTATISLSASGGGYGSVTRSVAVTVTDYGVPLGTIQVTPSGTLTINEGDATGGSLSVRLSAEPNADVTVSLAKTNADVTLSSTSLTFTTANWNTAQTVTVSAGEDTDATTDTDTITLSATGGIQASNVTKTVTITDTESTPAHECIETRTNSFTLSNPNSVHAAIRNSCDNNIKVRFRYTSNGSCIEDEGIDNNNFTPTFQWLRLNSLPAKVCVEYLDSTHQANSGYQSCGSLPTDCGTSGFTVVTPGRTTPSGTIQVTPAGTLTINEGASTNLSVSLSTAPTSDVRVTLTELANTGVTVIDTDTGTVGNQNTLTFTTTNWSTAQTVTVSAAEDNDATDDTATIRLSASGGGYVNATGSVTVNVTDDDEVKLNLSTATLSVTEGSNATFTVSLDSVPSGDVTVTLAQPSNTDVTVDTDTGAANNQNTLTFTTTDWSTAQTVTVSAAEDDDAIADTAAIGLSASGGGYGSATGNVAVNITDNDSPGLTINPDTLSITEGSSGNFSVSLTTQPSENVTVTIAQPSNTDITVDTDSGTSGNQNTLAFTTGNYNTAQSVTVNVAEDADTANDNATLNITASGADYTSVTGSVSVTATDNDTPGLTINPDTLNITEGGNNSFSVSLTTQPSENVTVTIAQPSNTDITVDTDSGTSGNQNTLTFTTGNYNTAQSVTVNVAEDADTVNDNATLNITASGADYTSVTGSVTVNATDTTTPTGTINVTPAGTLTIGEGASGNLSVSLSAQPASDVTVTLAKTNTDVTLSATSLTFTTGNWNTSQNVTVSAAQDADTTDDTDTITLSATGGIQASNVTRAVTVTDDDSADTTPTGTIQVTPAGTLSIDEGDSTGATLSVSLSAAPNADVTVSLAKTNADVTLSPTSLTFTTGNWNTSQNVTVSAAQDADTTDDTDTITLSATGGIQASNVTRAVTVTDDDSADTTPTGTIQVTPAGALSIDEGDSTGATLSVSLSAAPNADVTVSLAKTNADVTLSPTSLTFTSSNWDTSQTVTVSAAQDADSTADTDTITLSATGGIDASSVTKAVTITDNDTPRLTINPDTLNITEGGNNSFSVSLTTQPSENVIVTIAQPSNTDITVDTDSGTSGNQNTLSFTTGNYNTAQNVTVNVAEDADTANDNATLNITASGADYTSVTGSVTISATDTTTPTGTINVTPAGTLTIGEGASGNLSVSLSAQPASDVTVTLAKTNTDVTLSASTLTFTTSNYSTAQTVTVTAAEDNDTTDDSDTITLSASGGITAPNITRAITVTDNDTSSPFDGTIGVNPETITVGEGDTINIAITLSEAPTADVTLTSTIAGTSPFEEITLSVSNITTSNWDNDITLSIEAAQDSDYEDETGTILLEIEGNNGDVLASTRLSIAVEDDDTPPAGNIPTFGDQTQADLNLTQGVAITPVTLPAASGGDGALQYRISPSLPAGLNFNAVTREISGTPVTLGTTSHTLIASDSDNNTGAEDQASLGFNIGIRVSRDTATRQATQAWLSRFGRGVGEQAVQGIRKRIQQPVTTGSQPGAAQLQTNLGGHSIDLNQPLSSTAAGLLKQLDQLDRSNLLHGSRFSASGESGAGQIGIWGQGAYSDFAGEDNNIALDGKLRSLLLGSDYRRDNWAAGILLSRSNAEGDYRGEIITGELESDLTSVVPWGSIQMSEELSVWGAMGQGRGELQLKPVNESEIKTDLDWQMLAGGMQSRLIEAGERNRMGLSFTGDLLWTETTTDRVAMLQAVAGETRRVRLGLEADWRSRGGLTPRLELGIRHDSGDAETGLGVELGGGLTWRDGQGNRFEVNGRGLLTHNDSDSRDWGLSIVAQHDARPSSHRGFSMRLSHELGGSATGGLARLLSEDLLSADNTAVDYRWELELAYGMARARGLTGSGYTALSGGAGSGLGWRVGYRLQPEHTPEFEVDLHVLDAREADEVDPGVGLNFIWR